MSDEIQSCKEADLPGLFNLFKEVYPYNPNLPDRKYFDWQYKGTPFSQKQGYEFYLFWEAGVIKAFAGCLPVEYRLDGKLERGCWVYNWHTFSKGLYGFRLWEYLKENYGTFFLIGGTEDAHRIYKMMGITVLDQLPRWIAVLDQGSCQAILGQTKEFWGKFKQIPYSPGKEVSFIERFDDNEEFFLEEKLNVRGYCRRTGKFLNWRFKEIPGHNYQFIRSGNGQYGVFRIEKIKGHDQAATRIIEWTFDDGLSPQAMGLVCKASRQENSILIDFFTTTQLPGRSLEQCGFLAEKDIGFSIPRLFRPPKLTPGISFAIDRPQGSASEKLFADWHVTNADNDSERIKL